MIKPISITAIGSISPLGDSLEEVWANYKKQQHFFQKKSFDSCEEWVASLSKKSIAEIETLKQSDSKYKNLDNTVLFALLASRKAIKMAQWNAQDNFGINMGSSRGATALFEKYHQEFLEESKASTLSSPTTTLGNISSWLAHDLQTQGPEISHSITCSTALHALLNGVAWIQSGMVNKFMVGGSEAPLTPFTIAQMKALKIYSNSKEEYPCLALDLQKSRNTMILGEGASVACLEEGIKENSLATILGVGYATEILKHNISISSDAECFQRSMKMALGGSNPEDVDVIVMHAPGTIKGDLSEFKAIEKVFCNKTPSLTTNKWKVGHTFGASGALSLEFAVLMLLNQEFIGVPFVESYTPSKIKKIMVNAVGFGGNAVSVLLSK
ncbi:beta-ketoacyl synthase N-terminal-like domain-containing protein [uncultured Maribacter sp.]|uniref:beta-ketoacyl synthase N-terminal-like domain-containing protein n=1 Tax=uncultured Maribacter sp. TaxID=431308 RepID=UPI002636A966|nr:beta-ketoacyl synthase N-terminal-like domain-containing protein [uncultured Maribacter sp.]